ncbi:hypothetical protein Awo_c31070 [Acetobacterium woodii DSM 1030]|uniref:Uncharacterized protein n=1 Tax=Acetobacterium woodii (strain ATCC 29683 / DSM 1030 / JCM 2381 / KCTC 1655 / WB1) TaxID=931626 RepID=H6LIU6_ACEWD|nr:hypothetical protein Awo_c31070 [Acetobacterium woodii DSM 1030]
MFLRTKISKKEGGIFLGIAEQLEKEKKIRAEKNRILKIYKNMQMDKDIIKVLEGLISDAAFMRVSIEELKQKLIKEGLMEKFKNGSQVFDRERPEAKAFRDYGKQYDNIMKQLIDLMPAKEQKEEQDQLLQFFQSGKEAVKK